MANTCYFLQQLPPETRLQIYEYLYNETCEPLFVLRNDDSIQQPMHRWFAHPGAALLRTCKTIYHEAAPVMYAMANFRIQMYFGDGWPQYQYSGPLDSSNPVMKQMQHLDINVHLVDEAHVDPALHRLEMLANALEESNGELKTLRVTFKAVTSYQMRVNRELVGRHRDAAIRRLGEQYRAGVKVNRLYRKMLMESQIVSVN